MPCQQTLTLNFKEVWRQRAQANQHVFIQPFFLRKAYHLQGFEVFFISKRFTHWLSSLLWGGVLEKRAITRRKWQGTGQLKVTLNHLNSIQRTSPIHPRIVKALNSLKKRNDIVITKPSLQRLRSRDGQNCVCSLFRATLPNLFTLMTGDLKLVSDHLNTSTRSFGKRKSCTLTTLHKILPEEIANILGLPKTHKATLSMRPILSATGTPSGLKKS